MALPTVEPAPAGDAFCAIYQAYLDHGGPYSLQEAGNQFPPFTQEDVDAYASLQATAPEEIRSTVDKLVAYGQQMAQGNFTHGIDYENLLDGPGGLVLWVIPYCQLDAEFA